MQGCRTPFQECPSICDARHPFGTPRTKDQRAAGKGDMGCAKTALGGHRGPVAGCFYLDSLASALVPMLGPLVTGEPEHTW